MADAARLRLVTFLPAAAATPRVGALIAGDRVVDLSSVAPDMIALIEGGEPALTQARRLAATATDGVPLDKVRLLAPVPKPPRNVYCIGWNYLEHFAEGAAMRMKPAELPQHPVIFTKGTQAVNGPYDPVPFDPAVSETIDWEVEMAVVIGRKGRNIQEAEAMSHVFGFTVANDISARDMQQKKHGGQWFKGKSLDGHAPMGPCIVPAADIDPNDLRLVCRVNGVVKQDGRTSQMYFKLPRILAELSLGLTLEPGDVICTGTPPGVGGARTPPEFMKPGDVLESEIEGIGVLRNVIERV